MIWFIISGHKYGQNLLVTLPFVVIGCFCIIIPFLAHLGGGAGFWSTLAVLFLFGWFGGYSQAAVFALAGTMPFRITAAVMLGCAVSGLFSNFIRGITLYAMPDN